MSEKLAPQTPATDGKSSVPLDRSAGARILARSFYKELRSSGYTPRQLLTLSTELIELITHIRAALSHVRAVAEQLPQADRWKTFLEYVVAKITCPLPPWHRIDRLAMAG